MESSTACLRFIPLEHLQETNIHIRWLPERALRNQLARRPKRDGAFNGDLYLPLAAINKVYIVKGKKTLYPEQST